VKKLAIRVMLIISLFIPSTLNLPPPGTESWYVPIYPCVILEGPGIKFILQEPCGEIIGEFERWIPPKMKED